MHDTHTRVVLPRAPRARAMTRVPWPTTRDAETAGEFEAAAESVSLVRAAASADGATPRPRPRPAGLARAMDLSGFPGGAEVRVSRGA